MTILKPTVYKSRFTGGWYWQCDRCGAPGEGEVYVPFESMQSALTAATYHARICAIWVVDAA